MRKGEFFFLLASCVYRNRGDQCRRYEKNHSTNNGKKSEKKFFSFLLLPSLSLSHCWRIQKNFHNCQFIWVSPTQTHLPPHPSRLVDAAQRFKLNMLISSAYFVRKSIFRVVRFLAVASRIALAGSFGAARLTSRRWRRKLPCLPKKSGEKSIWKNLIRKLFINCDYE